MTEPIEEPVVVDHIIVVCKGCGGERTVYPDRPIRGAAELVDWIKTKPTACPCGALTCDLKCHLKPRSIQSVSVLASVKKT